MKAFLALNDKVLAGLKQNSIAASKKNFCSKCLSKIQIKSLNFLKDKKWSSQLIRIEKASV